MSLGEKIQRLRKESGMSQEQLAEGVTVSRQAVSKWELGESMPDAENLIQLSNLFNVSIDFLLKDSEYAPAAAEDAASVQAAVALPDKWALVAVGCVTAGLTTAFVGWLTVQTFVPLGVGFLLQIAGCIIFAATQTEQLRCIRRSYYYLLAFLLPPLPARVVVFYMILHYPRPFLTLWSSVLSIALSLILTGIAALTIRKKFPKYSK